jgi:hypothetical protein
MSIPFQVYSFITCPAIEAVNSPKSTSVSAAGGLGLRHHHLAAVGANLDPQPSHQIPHRGLA